MKKIISTFKNKYVLTVIILTVWVLFFDKNDLKTQIEFKKQVKQLEEERNYYAKENREVSRELKELTTNPKTIEKFAREKYYMKRDNEDIFVIVEEPTYAEAPADKTP
jgi:cell division protein FtsB